MVSSPTALVERLQAEQARFLAFLTPRLGSVEAAKDVLQSAMVKALEAGHSLKDGDRATAWFFQLLRNAVVDHHRRRTSESRVREASAAELSQSEIVELDRRVCACVESLLATVKPEYAEAVQAVELAGDSVAEYAARARITPGNARVRLHRARTALATRLLEMCGTCCRQGCTSCACETDSTLRAAPTPVPGLRRRVR